MAITLSDIMLCRTDLGFLGHPGKEIMEKVAKFAAKELNWDEQKPANEIRIREEILQVPE